MHKKTAGRGIRERILVHAARHFAQKGYNATSLREITRDARANSASLHYHFGSKAELYREVMDPLRRRLSEERHQALQAISPKLTGARRVKAIVRAYVGPHIRLCSEPEAENYLHIVARATSESHYPPEIQIPAEINTLRGHFVQALCDALPGTPRDLVIRAFSCTVDLMALAPVDTCYQALTGRSPWPKDPDALIDLVVDFCTAGILAVCKRS